MSSISDRYNSQEDCTVMVLMVYCRGNTCRGKAIFKYFFACDLFNIFACYLFLLAGVFLSFARIFVFTLLISSSS